MDMNLKKGFIRILQAEGIFYIVVLVIAIVVALARGI
jgi:hypothetical protein